jgi:hypothetical protein
MSGQPEGAEPRCGSSPDSRELACGFAPGRGAFCSWDRRCGRGRRSARFDRADSAATTTTRSRRVGPGLSRVMLDSASRLILYLVWQRRSTSARARPISDMVRASWRHDNGVAKWTGCRKEAESGPASDQIPWPFRPTRDRVGGRVTASLSRRGAGLDALRGARRGADSTRNRPREHGPSMGIGVRSIGTRGLWLGSTTLTARDGHAALSARSPGVRDFGSDMA